MELYNVYDINGSSIYNFVLASVWENTILYDMLMLKLTFLRGCCDIDSVIILMFYYFSCCYKLRLDCA